MIMKTIAAVFSLLFSCIAFAGDMISIQSVIAQQRYPWNGLVDIAVMFEGSADDVAEVTCSFVATNCATGAAVPVMSVIGDGTDTISGTTWTRRFIWNATNDVGAVKIDDLALTVEAKVMDGVQLWENGPYWAKCNVGATKPEEHGYYFWWGDTVGYKRNACNNGWVSVKDGTEFSFSSVNCPTDDKNITQLYTEGITDDMGRLVAAYDAATAYLGTPWRMPTSAEYSDLISKCTTTWIVRNGVYGRLVTGKGAFESRSIFLPAVGYGCDSSLANIGSYGIYWSSTPYFVSSLPYAACLGFSSASFDWDYYNRDYGRSVRPLREVDQDATSVSVIGAETIRLKLDCRIEERTCSAAGEVFRFDANWFDNCDEVRILDNGVVLTNGISGVYTWVPELCSSTQHLFRLEILSDGQVVGEESAGFLCAAPTIEHTTVVTKTAVEPTGIAPGMTAEIRCSRCGEIVQAATEIPAINYIRAVTAQQRYPWNGLVDIAVTIEGTADYVAEAECMFLATNSVTGVAVPVKSVVQNGSAIGSGTTWTLRYIWDAKKDVGAVKIDKVDFLVMLKPHVGVQLWKDGPYWAECNVGATKPEECGYYFWWGDTVGYKRNAGNNEWVSVRDGTEFSFNIENCPTYGKNTSQLQSAGYIDSTGNLVPVHDAATAHLGASWRMPNDGEIAALINNCTTTWVTTNGVLGRLVTGKDAFASKSIFLPAAGYGGNSSLNNVGSDGYNWSSTPCTGASSSAYRLYFHSWAFYRNGDCYYRYLGHPVRPLRASDSGSDTSSTDAKSTSIALDCREGVRIAATTEMIAYSTEWIDDVPDGATAVVMVGDLVLTNATGSGTAEWTPDHNGEYVLTHKIIKDGIQISDVFSSAFKVSGLVEISDVAVRQRYPWNGLVDIDYTVQGDATRYELQVEVEDVQGKVKYYPTKYLSTMDVSEGRHRLTWDVEGENVTIVSTNVVVKLSLIQSHFNGVTNELYYIVDLSGGSAAEKYPVVMRSSIPNGAWSDEYKSNKLVLKKILPGDIPTRKARITRPYYMGVFEVTRKQYELVTGAYPTPINEYCNIHGDYSPVNGVSYNMIRGSAIGGNWPESAEVDADSFLGILRRKTSQFFDLPTEAQWEYACRAGTSSKYNNGGSTVEDLVSLARFSDNWDDGKGGYSMWYTTVGSYAPNAWGLYDMHGNVRELCRDRYSYDYVVEVAGTPFYYDNTDYAGVVMTGDDPVGAPSGYGNDGKTGERRVCKGGSFGSTSVDCTSGQTGYRYTTYGDYATGFRLACTAFEFPLPVEDCIPVAENFATCQLNTDSRLKIVPPNGIKINYDPQWNTGLVVNVYNNCTNVKNSQEAGSVIWEAETAGSYTFEHVTLSSDGSEIFPRYSINVLAADSTGAIRLGSDDEGLYAGMFSNCFWLSRVDYRGLPNDLIDGLFLGCGNLKEVRIETPGFNGEGVGIEMSEMLDVVLRDKQLLFEGCASLSSVSIWSSILELRQILPCDYTNLNVVTVADGTSDIPAAYFRGCSALERVEIPETVERIGDCAFEGCGLLSHVRLPIGINPSLSELSRMGLSLTQMDVEQIANFSVIGKSLVRYCGSKSEASITIPTSIERICDSTLCEMYYLDDVTIPDSVEEIGDGAFSNCTEMASLELGSGLRRVGCGAFYDCISLESVVFNEGLTSLGERAFFGPTRLKSVSLPASLEYIGMDAFKGSAYITGVTVPTHLKTMQELFPDSYQNIESVVVPEGEGVIIDSMFAGCAKLKTIIIPVSVTNIGASAFAYCESLEELGLPDEVTKLGARAFYGCRELRTVSLPQKLTAIEDETFAGCPWLDSLVVPAAVSRMGSKIYSGGMAYSQELQPGWLFYQYNNETRNGVYGQWYYGQLASLTGIYFLGDAPTVESDTYAGMPESMKSYVINGSKGWYLAGAPTLPPSGWPTSGNMRPITYWTPNEFEVTFDGNGGSPATYVAKQITDTTYSLPKSNPTRTGYLFDGWWTEKTAGAQVYWNSRVTAKKAHTLYAHWRSLSDSITVIFNPNGGTVDPDEVTYPAGVTYGDMPVPTRIGHRFDGWYTSQTGGDLVDEATAVSKVNNELYAHWTPITYSVVYNANGGSGTMSAQTHTYNVSQALTANAYYLNGFKFTGWSETAGGSVKYANNAVVENLAEVQGQIVTLYAVWNGASYAVRFDGNGGSGIMENQAHTVSVRQSLSKCVFIRTGYAFIGWATTPSGVVEYEDEEEVQNLTMQSGNTVSLYAVWSPIQYSIVYNANGGTGSMPTQTAIYDKESDIAACGYVRSGFAFVGWSDEEDGEVIYTPGDKVLNLSNLSGATVNLYAIWDQQSVAAPVFSPVNGSVFADSCQVTISCPTAGADVYYRVGATPKASSKYLYSAPFSISDTSTIYAFAKLGSVTSEVVTATLTKGVVETFETAVGAVGITSFTHGGDATWFIDKSVGAHSGGSCVRSGAVGDDQSSWFEAEVEGPGTISFYWKASCEDDALDEFDHLEFWIDENEIDRLDGETDWLEMSVEVGSGKHTLHWVYVKDESDLDGEDCGWVDDIVWSPLSAPADPIPDIGDSPSAVDVAVVVADAADEKVAANIDETNYNDFRDWAGNVKAVDGNVAAGAAGVMASETAWLSYALGQGALLGEAPTDEDLSVETFTPSTKSGKFDFTVSVKDIEVSSEATKENLKKVFGLEGAATLDDAAFSSDKVDIEFATPVDGNVKFTAGPKDADAKAFFMKVKLNP